jgi:hypothetical protein
VQLEQPPHSHAQCLPLLDYLIAGQDFGPALHALSHSVDNR